MIYFFDMDGTILPNTTGLLETAKYFNTKNELLKLEKDFSLNLLDTTQFTHAISRLWGTIPEKISSLIFNNAPKLEGLYECLEDIRKNGDYSCIITLSQDFFAEHFKDYGVDFIYSTPYPPNHENSENLKCLTAEDKKKLAIELCIKMDIQPSDCVAFGDSSGDLQLFEAVGYALAVNPIKDLSKYVALTYNGSSILEAYKEIKNYKNYIENPVPKISKSSCVNFNYGRNVIVNAFTDCVKEQYNHPIKEIEFKNLWLKKINNNPYLTSIGWYTPPEHGMAILFSHDKAVQRSHFTTFRSPEFFSSETEIDWGSGLITGYASNIDTQNNIPGDFGTTIYFGNDPDIIQYVKLCIYASECIFHLLLDGTVKTSAELYNAAISIFTSYGLEGKSYSTTSGLFNLGHTLHPINTTKTISKYRQFVSNEDNWDLRNGVIFTFEPQYRSINNADYPRLMHHYMIRYLDGEFQICKSCVDNSITHNGVVRKGIVCSKESC